MAKRQHRPGGALASVEAKRESPGARLTPHSLVELIEAGREAAGEFRHDEAVGHFQAALASPLLNAEQRARVKCALAESLEALARYREAIEVMAEYEGAAGRAGLSPAALFQIWLRMGSAYGYTGDHPRAISHLKSALALAEERRDHEDLGAGHLVLGRIYRAIGETRFARDHLRIALQHNRHVGQWVALAQNYFLLGNVCVGEGDMRGAREHFEQAVKIVGDRHAPLLLGSIYTSLSNLILLQEQGQASEGVDVLEKAIFHLKQSKNDRLLAYAYSNLGYVLANIGDWNRAKQVLYYAIELGRATGDRAVEGTALDTLGEIFMLQGNYAEAERMIAQAVEYMRAANFPYGEVQATQTLGRCLLARGDCERAIDAFEQEVALATRTEDKRATTAAQLYLAQAQLEVGGLANAQRLLERAVENLDLSANMSLVGHFDVVKGMLQTRLGNYDEARHSFGQAITVFAMVSDLYREALARHHLGRVFGATGDLERARAELVQAREAAARLGAEPLLAQTADALADLQTGLSAERSPRAGRYLPREAERAAFAPAAAPAEVGAVSPAAIARIVGAAPSRELVLNELAAILYEVAGVMPVVAFEETPRGLKPVAVSGCDAHEAEALAEKVERAVQSPSLLGGGEAVYKLRPGDGTRWVVYCGARQGRTSRRDGLESLFRIAEMGLELCAYRAERRSVIGYQSPEANSEVHLPGFIFASPAMRALVADIHKIRSSRVTALITGESGTGKEVVARAVHLLSERRDAPFIAFNCTIASPEVINSQLFGHRKGAFTGAVNDHQGVIRSADKGTLLLDEIGDLALEVQPKLLRFLQDGEVHPLGELTPAKVDARVIAATNADLERAVAEGRFREDLYYRLNVIRLHVPPLRERREEIPLLVDYFLKKYGEQSKKRDITISPQALDLLMVYDWPGNVRQLANEVQRLVAYAHSGAALTEHDLSPTIYRGRRAPESEGKTLSSVTSALLHAVPTPGERPIEVDYRPGEKTLGDVVEEVERQIIEDAMRRHQGRRNAVCEELGITRKGLYLKLRRFNMQ
jgi:hydrogenase-4 transcriptional activator